MLKAWGNYNYVQATVGTKGFKTCICVHITVHIIKVSERVQKRGWKHIEISSEPWFSFPFTHFCMSHTLVSLIIIIVVVVVAEYTVPHTAQCKYRKYFVGIRFVANVATDEEVEYIIYCDLLSTKNKFYGIIINRKLT